MTNMMTAMKNLGNKITGKNIDGANLVTVVDDIANKYEGGGGGGGGGGDNGNVILKKSEAVKIDSWTYDFSPTTLKDCFDCLSSGNDVLIIEDVPRADVGLYYQGYVPLDKDSAYYTVNTLEGGSYQYELALNFGSYYFVGSYLPFEEGDTADSWLDQPLVVTVPD